MFEIRSSVARYIGACVWLLGVSFLLADAAVPVRAQGPPRCDEQAVGDALTQVLSTTPRAADGTLVLAYDHRKAAEWWKAYEWEGGCLNHVTSQDTRFEVRPEDRPRLTLKKGTPVRIFVVRTNPLLYTTAAGESSEEDRPDLAAMQQLAGLLSGVAVTSVKAAGVRSAAANADAMLAAALTASNDQDRTSLLLALGAADQEQVDRSDQLIKALNELGTILDGSTLKDSEKALKMAAGEFRMALVDWQTAVTRLQTHLREVELGLSTTVLEADQWPKAPDVSGVRAARANLEAVEPICEDVLEKLESYLVLAVETHLSQEDRRKRDNLAETLSASNCDGVADAVQARKPVQVIVQAIVESQYMLPQAARDAVEAGLELLESHRELVTTRSSMLANAKKLLDEQKDGFPQAPFYEALKQRYGEATSWTSVRGLTCGVIELSRAQGAAVDVRWSKIRTESAMIKADDRVKKLVDPDRPTDVTIKYELARRSVWQNLDVNFGVIWTDVANPTFSAVADPEESMDAAAVIAAAESGGDDEPDPVLRIRQTDEETRAGDLALFATWNLLEPKEAIPLGIQIGAGTDTDHPSFFAGVSVGLGQYIRLSGGYSWHKVKELDGQDPGDVVASDDAIQTRDHFDGGTYLALTIAIDELPFFKPKEED